MSKRYILDEDNNVRREKTSVWTIVRKILVFFVGTLSLAVVYYWIFALFFSTDKEKILEQENKMYEKVVPQMEEKADLVADVVGPNAIRIFLDIIDETLIVILVFGKVFQLEALHLALFMY